MENVMDAYFSTDFRGLRLVVNPDSTEHKNEYMFLHGYTKDLQSVCIGFQATPEQLRLIAGKCIELAEKIENKEAAA